MRASVLLIFVLVLTIAVSAAAERQAAIIGLRLIAVKTEKEAVDLLARLQAGEAFEVLARKYSTDFSSGAGGYLGMVTTSELRHEFQEALSGVLPGQISPIVKLGQEYVLLQIMSDAEAHYNLGNVLRVQGRVDEAIAEYREALRFDSNHAEAHHNLGAAFQDRGKLDEAAAEYHEAARVRPAFAEAHYNLGVVLSLQDKLVDATAEYREALRINPHFAEAHQNLGSALQDQGLLDEAVKEYREAVRINPESLRAHVNRGVALTMQNKLEKARP